MFIELTNFNEEQQLFNTDYIVSVAAHLDNLDVDGDLKLALKDKDYCVIWVAGLNKPKVILNSYKEVVALCQSGRKVA